MNLFIRNETQKEWLRRLNEKQTVFKNKADRIDELAIFPTENVLELIDMGYTRSTLSKTYGGEGLKIYDMVLLQETLASFDASTALSIGWHLSVVGEIFEKKHWTTSDLDFIAGEVVKGALINRAASEAQTGSPTRGGRPETKAVKKGEHWIISGRKIFTTLSPVLTYFLVSAWIEEQQTIGYFLLHKDLEGLQIEETWDTISLRGTGSHDLVLEQVVVNHNKLVELNNLPSGKELNGWLLHIPACYLGIAQAARDYALQFANQYSPNSISGPISQLSNVQHLIGEMDLELMKARHFLYSVAEAYDDVTRRDYLSTELGAAKHAVTNSAITIVDKAMRLVGIKSLHRNNPLQRYYRDVRAGLHNPPMDNVTLQKIALAAIEQEKAKVAT
ncbi:acyl-CoA/acyl-ACP dehydrogenase [Paenibacillus validus]|uniref:Acyl-CoA dehydrogenase n=1 Tax=Paenibacillus validus TaxID=44253 RepID=A0A7X2ZCJ9_9BACL|nr:acyl-CoA dehydrogenase family protein [Paenibacillus validus]MED4600669.1 acyl-CoA/acyl-ACP dehydrogenase [Paenibacillus validus]MED4605308.1 acyl-CoA/acyl-ACP dehydrogenase [Paenibacillus validus]MUG71795.1 acyl-CoA dehydrogenase [Paenibacillus validus]